MNLYLEEAITLDAVTERGSQLKTRKAELKDFLAPLPLPTEHSVRCRKSNLTSWLLHVNFVPEVDL
ncbi:MULTISPECIES: hypothetical protein [Hyphomicrobiales]|uniref:hypothetical protein n=1 Tax=Hyphomicrobiales TaxID=356 RepID=UPI00088C719E|nr:hypothetical protein [Agrobacterium pusense]MBW9080579.1 hypothetical protein [Agrobacterium pusense]WKD47923.1 hypothetical protein M8C82_25465 [Agrobacterium pusense]SDF63557.1 hypothetical protein SAMN05421750_12013 [Agrobacterium pusense]